MKKINLFENLHILLWLAKDTCWLLDFKIGGILMVIPTIAVAIYITWKSHQNNQSILPNLAVLCWILANSNWMLGEFLNYTHQLLSVIIFGIGFICIGYYFVKHKHSFNEA